MLHHYKQLNLTEISDEISRFESYLHLNLGEPLNLGLSRDYIVIIRETKVAEGSGELVTSYTNMNVIVGEEK